MAHRNGDYLGKPEPPETLMMKSMLEGKATHEELIDTLSYIRDLGMDETDAHVAHDAGGPDDPAPRWRLLDLAFKGLMFERGML